MTPEEKAREQIDAMLTASGWILQDYKALNLGAGKGIALREVPLKSGRCDYLLIVDRIPVGVVEAKKQGTTLSTVADQSGHYAENLPDFLAALTPGKLRFLYESTGVETFFRDDCDPAPRSRRAFSFHRPETLAAFLVETRTLRGRLAAMPFAHPLPTQNLRACQVEGITHLEESFAEDRPRALIQMATGAGKTYTACSFTYRLIKFGGARRVLFLVDRANLGRQAMAEFQQFVAPDTLHPFALKGILTDGKSILYNLGEAALLELGKNGQTAFEKVLEQFCHRLEFDDVTKLVTRFYPAGRNSAVVVDPRHQFGKPIIAGTSIATESIASRIRGGDKMEDVAADLVLTPEQVADAWNFENCEAA